MAGARLDLPFGLDVRGGPVKTKVSSVVGVVSDTRIHNHQNRHMSELFRTTSQEMQRHLIKLAVEAGASEHSWRRQRCVSRRLHSNSSYVSSRPYVVHALQSL